MRPKAQVDPGWTRSLIPLSRQFQARSTAARLSSAIMRPTPFLPVTARSACRLKRSTATLPMTSAPPMRPALSRRMLGAPAVLSTYSRLVIDPNRGLNDPTLVMRYSDGAVVPGNAYIDAAEIARRSARFWTPYRDEIAATVDAMMATGEPPALISIHSFTPVMRSLARPWKIGILWDRDERIPKPLIEALIAEPDLRADEVGDNEPYDGALAGDTIDEIATSRGLANVLIEIRQDLIAERNSAIAWAERIGRMLAPIIADRRSREPADLGSRAQTTAHRRGKPSSVT